MELRFLPQYLRGSEEEPEVIGETMKISSDTKVTEETKAYAVAVAIALIVASALLVTYLLVLRPAPDRFMTIYMLDSNGTTDYPEHLVAHVNSTFSVYVFVENHMGQDLSNVQVQVKFTNNSNPTFPLDTAAVQTLRYSSPFKDGASEEKIATVSLNDPGNYLVDFELWTQKDSSATLLYSGDLVTLNVQVASQ